MGEALTLTMGDAVADGEPRAGRTGGSARGTIPPRSGPTRGVQLHGAAAVSASGVYICCLLTLDGHDRTSTTRFIDIHIICDGGSPLSFSWPRDKRNPTRGE